MSQPAPPPGAVSEPPGCRGAARLVRRVVPGPADPRRGAAQDPPTGQYGRPGDRDPATGDQGRPGEQGRSSEEGLRRDPGRSSDEDLPRDPGRSSEEELEREGLAFFRGLLVALVVSAVAYAVIALIVLAAVKLPR